MTRVGKKEERKNRCPKKRKSFISKKTGPIKNGFKEHENALNEKCAFIPKIKGIKNV